MFGQMLGVSPDNAPGGAGLAAGGCFIICKSVYTKITLDRYFPAIIKLHGPEGTGLHTFHAADTPILINQHNPLIIPENRVHRTCLLTGGLCTVVAVDGIIVRRVFNNAHQAGTDTKPMFLLAGDFAGMAPHTILFIKHQ